VVSVYVDIFRRISTKHLQIDRKTFYAKEMNHISQVEATPATLNYPEVLTVEGGNNTHLQLASLADVPQLFELLSAHREYLEQYQHFDLEGLSPQKVRKIVQNTLSATAEGRRLNYRIYNQDKMIGNVNFYDMDLQNHSASLAAWISPEYQGQGIVYASCQSLVRYGFERLGLDRIITEIVSDNRRSERLAQRAGARLLEGITRQEEVDGRIYNYRTWELAKP
jgi:RimJ/RimL family protein N-acetyltransferase